jgi:hypothetical protein
VRSKKSRDEAGSLVMLRPLTGLLKSTQERDEDWWSYSKLTHVGSPAQRRAQASDEAAMPPQIWGPVPLL